MTTREQVIAAKGGKCMDCGESRAPALMVQTPHTRTSTWEQYWQDLLTGNHSIYITCRNCAACTRSKGSTSSSKKLVTFIRGEIGDVFLWLEGKPVVIVTSEGEYLTYPDYKEWAGPKPEIPSYLLTVEQEVSI